LEVIFIGGGKKGGNKTPLFELKKKKKMVV